MVALHSSARALGGAALLLSPLALLAQQPGSQKHDAHPPLTIGECAAGGVCTPQSAAIVVDSNWMWVHKKGTYTNCYEGNQWDKTLCPDPKTCAQNCALDAGSVAEYQSTYGISTTGNSLRLNYVTKGQSGPGNVGSRTFLMEDDQHYKMFKLKNREFTFDVDVSNLPCGLNGALYFVEMDADGGMSKYPGNKAGAQYGTGYCDAQCPHDIKFINGEANVLDWTGSDSSSGTGKYGTCCTELDIWESNRAAQALTPHTCSGGASSGQYRCQNATECGDNKAGDRFKGVCDKNGCDFNPYRLGDKLFYGNGSQFKVDTTKPFTVVTQFVTEDGTDTGDLVEIRRKYVQGGVVIENTNITLAGKTHNSISDDFCKAEYKIFNGTNRDAYEEHGGLKKTGDVMGRGMVLVMSLWDDHDAGMLWLDSIYPRTNTDPLPPGAARGPCATTSGDPATDEKEYPGSYVIYSNIKTGPFGSTFNGGTGPSPPAPPAPGPPAPPAPPSPSGCPGGTLSKCMALCPANPPIVYKDCIADCGKRCPPGTE